MVELVKQGQRPPSPQDAAGHPHHPGAVPHLPIDRDGPVLWTLVRDEEPRHPNLPRLRYRVPFPAGCRDEVVAAVQRYVPRIWLGESERAEGHIGRPDVKGHKERTRGRTQ